MRAAAACVADRVVVFGGATDGVTGLASCESYDTRSGERALRLLLLLLLPCVAAGVTERDSVCAGRWADSAATAPMAKARTYIAAVAVPW